MATFHLKKILKCNAANVIWKISFLAFVFSGGCEDDKTAVFLYIHEQLVCSK